MCIYIINIYTHTRYIAFVWLINGLSLLVSRTFFCGLLPGEASLAELICQGLVECGERRPMGKLMGNGGIRPWDSMGLG